MKTPLWIIISTFVLFGGFVGFMMSRPTKEPTYFGRPLSEVLRNETGGRTNKLTLQEMLTLSQVVTSEEPEIATFELPISYDVLQKIGLIYLLVDADQNGQQPSGVGEFQEVERATNGNCLVSWNTSFDPPGSHRLRAELYVKGQKSKRDTRKVLGPVLAFVSTNVCQVDLYFDRRGAILNARLIGSNATYEIEIQSPDGSLVKTLLGKTTNGVIDRRWDLKDNFGNVCNNESFQIFFKITFPDRTNATSTTRAGMGRTGN